MQREQRGLGQQPRRHQRGGRPRRRARAGCGPASSDDVERAIGAVEQRRAEQIEHRAEQREEQVAQRGRQRLGAAVEADQRHRGEGQQLQRDVEIEQIAAEEDGVQRAPDRQQQRPEHERRARLARARAAAEVGAREQPDRADHERGGHQHHGRQAVGAQRDAERRRPAAQRDRRSARAARQTPAAIATATPSPTGISDQRDAVRQTPAERQATAARPRPAA